MLRVSSAKDLSLPSSAGPGDNLWQSKARLPFPVPRNMTVYRLPDGRLVLYSVVAMHEEGMRALEALGTPAIMIMPHDRHQMDAPSTRSATPPFASLLPTLRARERSRWTATFRSSPRWTSAPIRSLARAITRSSGAADCRRDRVVCDRAPRQRAFTGRSLRPGDEAVRPAGRWFRRRQSGPFSRGRRSPEVRAWLTGLAERADVRMVLVGHGDALTSNVASELSSRQPRRSERSFP